MGRDDENITVGDIYANGFTRTIKAIVLVLSVVVYLGMLGYTGAHNFTLMFNGVPENLRIWAIVGVIALELSAIGLPLAIHFWTFQPAQRIVAFLFYALDLALLWFNVLIDFSLVSGQALNDWESLYLSFIVPATPIIAGAGWTVIWLLDPYSVRISKLETLKTAMEEARMTHAVREAQSQSVNQYVEAAGRTLTHGIMHRAVGRPARRFFPRSRDVEEADEDEYEEVEEVTQSPSRDGREAGFTKPLRSR